MASSIGARVATTACAALRRANRGGSTRRPSSPLSASAEFPLATWPQPRHPEHMTNPKKQKGDRAELEAAALLTDLLEVPVRRKLGAGRIDDTGDLDGVPGHVVQVASWADTAAAARIKPREAEQQRINASAAHAVSLVRFRGGTWRVVLTIEQWARYVALVKP